MFPNQSYIEFEKSLKPQLIVVIDTEEEFDWSKEPNSNADSVDAIEDISNVQDIFNEYGIIPCYVVDYPIASHEKSVKILKEFLDEGQCEIGAHLHPWVTPPIREKMTRANMFPGNLDYDLEYEKLSTLTKKIIESFGVQPECYKAGRYGIGENTEKIIKDLGYRIDLSLCSAFDCRHEGGPDFSSHKSFPFWFGASEDLLELPLNGAFVGMAGMFSKHIYNLAGRFEILKARAILSRLRIVDRLMLSPEGYSVQEHKRLTMSQFNQGIRYFTWSFHSPSVVPGMTPYTRNKSDVRKFLDSFRTYFDFFRDELGGEFTTPSKIKMQLESKI